MIQNIKSFFYSIYNTIRWLPIIWRNRSFDFQFILILMRKQLYDMEKLFDDSYSNDKYYKDRINLAITLMERVYFDDYYEYNPFSSEHSEGVKDIISYYDNELIDILHEVTNYSDIELLTICLDDNPTEYLTMDEYIISLRNNLYQYRVYKFIINKCDEKRNKAKRLLWRIFEQNLEQWWN